MGAGAEFVEAMHRLVSQLFGNIRMRFACCSFAVGQDCGGSIQRVGSKLPRGFR